MRRALAVLLALMAAAAPSAAGAGRQVPQGFFGVMADGVLLDRTDAQLAHEFDVMQANGVESVRIVVYWDTLQPNAPGSLTSDAPMWFFACHSSNTALSCLPATTNIGPEPLLRT